MLLECKKIEGRQQMEKQLSLRLREVREEKGFSQTEVAHHLNISRQAVSNWEKGKSSPDIDNIILLSKLYGMSLDDFLEVNAQNQTIENGESIEKEKTEIKEQIEKELNEDSSKEDSEKRVLEILCLAVITVLLSRFPVIGMIAVILIGIWMKKTKRNYKIIYVLCGICFLVSLYNTLVLIDHLYFDFGKAIIEKA